MAVAAKGEAGGLRGASDLLARARRRPEIVIAVLVGAVFFLVELLPRSLPLGVRAAAIVFGAQSALAVVGVVLVQRGDGILSFCQVQLGSVGAAVFYGIVSKHSLVAAARHVGLHGAAPRWLLAVEWFGAGLLGIALAGLTGVITHLVVIRRFAGRPPLVGTVATIAVGQALLYAAGTNGVLRLFGYGSRKPLGGPIPPPYDLTVTISPTRFHLADLLSVAAIAVAVVAVRLFLVRTRLGNAVRASAADPERARTLGVPTAAVGSVVWLIAGTVSGIAGVLLVASQGGGATGGGTTTLTRVLGAVVAAGAGNLGLAVFVVFGFALVDQATTWAYGNGSLTDLFVLGLVLVFLLVRPSRTSGRGDTGSWRAAREVRPVPAELRGLPEVARLRRRGGIALGLAALALPFVLTPADTFNASTAAVFGMVGLSLLVLTGWSGLISLGQFAFATIGAFTVAIVDGRWGLPAPLALVLAALAGGASAVVVGIPALRVRGLQLAVTSLGFALVTTNVLLSERYGGRFIPKTLDRPSLFGLSTAGERSFYYLVVVVLALFVIAVVGVRRSRTGRALIALRDNERAAASFGISLVRARVETFALSGAIAAVAGGLYAYQQGGVTVGDFSVDVGISLFLMVIIGGLGSVAGPLLGAVVVGFFTTRLGGTASLLTAVFVLLVLLFAEGGLNEVAFKGRDVLLRRIAVRRRIAVPSLLADGGTVPGEGRVAIRPLSSVATPEDGVPVRYRLPRRKLVLEKVGSDATGAQ